MVVFLLMLISLALVIISVIFNGQGWAVFSGLISTCVLILSLVYSFCAPISYVKKEAKSFSIYEGKKAIYVESDLGDFKLTSMSDRKFLTAKKIYLVTPKNSWGWKRAVHQYITME